MSAANSRARGSIFRASPVLVVLCLLLALGAAGARAESAVWVLELEGAIGPASGDYITRNLADAEEAGAELFVIRLDTPGGLDKSMRSIIKAILASSVPVATWVAPEGSRAASAGTYIAYASHVAAMAPATNLGAATPVSMGGGGSPLPSPGGGEPGDGGSESENGGDGDSGPEAGTPQPGTAMERKVINDAVAYIRGLAELRGRNADWAEQAVRSGASLSAPEALERDVIDLIAADLDTLLQAVDGLEVETSAGIVTLETAGAEVNRIQPDWRNEFLALITDPNVAYILLMLGIYGLILEFYNPGIGVAGVTGVICLLLGFYALQMLPVSYAGLGLMVVGVGLMVAEAFSPSFGVFGVGGAIAFGVGSVLLLDTDLPAYQVSMPLIAAFVVASVGICIFAAGAALRAHRERIVSGREAILGARGKALEDFEPHDGAYRGRVRMMSETWHARSDQGVQAGDPVRVTNLDGLILTVTPAPSDDPALYPGNAG